LEIQGKWGGCGGVVKRTRGGVSGGVGGGGGWGAGGGRVKVKKGG